MAGSIRPILKAWQILTSATQWADVGTGFQRDIGVRYGDDWAVIDADDSASVGNVKAGLDDLDIRLPEVLTPGGNRHFYLKVQHAPKDFSWYRLPLALGPAEFRVRNAYAAAPCGEIECCLYRFFSGYPRQSPLRTAPIFGKQRAHKAG